MNVYEKINSVIENKGAAFFMLLDPDKLENGQIGEFAVYCEKNSVDAFLIGGSLLMEGELDEFIIKLKSFSNIPAIIFPGAVNQLSKNADALLYLSVVSGRNPEHLIGKHVLAAPLIKKMNLETLSTAYMLIESGTSTTAQYMSGSFPIPRNKPEIATATALAAQYLGMKFIYLEAGSGAEKTVPDEMIKTVSEICDIPVITGGGIRSSQTAFEKVKAGAKIIVTGNHFENHNNWHLIKEFSEAIHSKIGINI